jgi:AAHS family 3-hydroxyphenylpropionic acid transporter
MTEHPKPGAGSSRAALTVFLCFLVAVLEGYDLQVIGVAAPQLAKDLMLSPQQTGWAFSASLLGLAIGALLGGRLADRLGRKPALLVSVLVFGVFTFATERAWGLSSLLALRFLTGLGLGGSMPNIIAIVSEVARRGRTTMVVAGMSCGLAVGGVIVSLLARFAPGGLDWHGLFMIGGVAPLLLTPVLALALPETHRRADHRAGEAAPSARGAVFGPQALVMTLSLWVVFALTLLQLSLLLNWLPSLMIAKGFARQQAFTASLALNLGSIAGSLCIGWLCDRFGAKRPMVAVYLIMAATMFGLSATQALSPLLILSFAAGFLVLGAQFVLYGLSPRLYPENARGFGVGAAVAAGRIGAIAGPLIAGQMLQLGASGGQVVLTMAPLVLVAAVAMLILGWAAKDRLAPGAEKA